MKNSYIWVYVHTSIQSYIQSKGCMITKIESFYGNLLICANMGTRMT